MRPLGKEYKEAKASSGDFERLPVGGYVCRIIKVTDKVSSQKGSPYLEVIYDIAEGEYTNFYSDDWGQNNEWAHTSKHYYTEKAMGMFKGFLKAVDESNGTSFEAEAETGLNESALVGKLVGYVIGEEEYEGNDGSIKTKLKVRNTKSVKAIREGKFKEPQLKTLGGADTQGAAAQPAGFSEVTDDDLPF